MAQALARLDSAEHLTGRQKLAVLCMTLGSEATAAITDRLPADQVEKVSFEIARTDNVGRDVVDAVLKEWIHTMQAAESIGNGGIDYAREILERSFGPQKASQLLKRIQGQLADVAGLERLRNADPGQLGHMLREEHPQTLALILAHLDAYQTAAILKEIDPELGGDIIFRIACMEKVSPEMLQLIERSLGTEGSLKASEDMSASGGPEAVAAVMNLLNSSLEQELLEKLGRKDPELCEQVKGLMFVFEDIGGLDDQALQRLLREVDARALALALKTASDELKTKIMGAMPQRAVSALADEMEYLGPVRRRDVEAAQTSIVAKIRSLEESGEIVLSGGGDDDVVV